MTDEETPKAPDPEELVRFEIRNQVAWITIDNPDKGNALSPEMRDRMAGLINGCNGRFEARAIVITATGRKLFCPGADISVDREFAPRPDDAPPSVVGESRRMMLEGQLKLMPAILDSELPVIAAVNGTAAGVGVSAMSRGDTGLASSTGPAVRLARGLNGAKPFTKRQSCRQSGQVEWEWNQRLVHLSQKACWQGSRFSF